PAPHDGDVFAPPPFQDARARHGPFAVRAVHDEGTTGERGGSFLEGCEFDVVRARDVAGDVLALLPDVEEPPAGSFRRTDDGRGALWKVRRTPGGHAAVELTDEAFVGDVQALPHE